MTRLQDAMAEVPAIVGSGFRCLTHGRYLLCRVQDAGRARQWLADVLAVGLVHTLHDVELARRARGAPGDGHGEITEAVTIGLSHGGLRALGLQDDPARPFPSAFRVGMGHPVRRRLLGEDPRPGGADDEFEDWRWSDTGSGGEAIVDMLVAHYWHKDVDPHPLLDPGALATHGLQAQTVSTYADAIRSRADGRHMMFEPFGFRDGVGQPRLRGLPLLEKRPARLRPDRPLRHAEANLVQPGEFILGQRNEYGERSYTPNVQGWPGGAGQPEHFSTHGTYLVARQIQQYVDVFHAFAKHSGVPRLASKMTGRRPNGWPLTTGPHPLGDPDDFLYLASDPPGLECPRGAHVRRAHPRDALAHDEAEGVPSSRLHRLLRRGRVYVEDSAPSPTGDGIMFVALNADLDRQFEFVHRNWIMGSRFGDLADEQDPLLGVRPGRMFTVPGCPVGPRVGPMPPFTRVQGGGYFLVPGMSALRFIASL